MWTLRRGFSEVAVVRQKKKHQQLVSGVYLANLFILIILDMDIHKPRSSNQTSPSLKLSNGYILPEGKLTPNALFVGGIDMKVDENEIRDFFARYGPVKEVKIITYRGGICKGYGFVYFNEDVNIQSIIEQQISFKGRKLKLGPAIMKERSSRSMPSRLFGPAPWMSPTQYLCCSCCSPMGGGVTQPSPIINGGSLYNQPYSYSNFGGVMIPQMPMNYAQNAYAYQSYVDCGVQTMMTVL
ncbi:deleted in azoospermia-like isoform X2 [Sebastes fasciatus]|uniref:deleted in azoospermia-like isoform X2 n=2 Tax=Sebastes TaxID=34820 RepID=UPI003D9E8530